MIGDLLVDLAEASLDVADLLDERDRPPGRRRRPPGGRRRPPTRTAPLSFPAGSRLKPAGTSCGGTLAAVSAAKSHPVLEIDGARFTSRPRPRRDREVVPAGVDPRPPDQPPRVGAPGRSSPRRGKARRSSTCSPGDLSSGAPCPSSTPTSAARFREQAGHQVSANGRGWAGTTSPGPSAARVKRGSEGSTLDPISDPRSEPSGST